jgi:hypothetical protein
MHFVKRGRNLSPMPPAHDLSPMPKSALAVRRTTKTRRIWFSKLRIAAGHPVSRGLEGKNSSASVQALLAPAMPVVFQSVAN